jgi:hypothetical protein
MSRQVAVLCRRIACGLFALAALPPNAWSEQAETHCALERRWDDFSSVAVSVEGADGDDPRHSMKVETTVYDNGSLVIASDVEPRLEVIWWARPEGRIALGNSASAPLELSEISMLYELPLATLKSRFPGPCDLRANIHYPVKTGSGDDSVSGYIERDGDAIRFELREKRGHDEITYSGGFVYKASRGKIPAGLAIAGWTVFRGSINPEDGERSSFATLGDLQEGASHQQ